MRTLNLLVSLFTFLISAAQANSACDFKTGKYVEELQNPINIQNIQINVPKSAKYAKNLIKIITSNSLNISPDLKKRFKAEIIVNYQFGKCEFKGTVRQHGDWKDHIGMLSGGRPYRSLNVELDTGNVVSAVQFKLLIPKTRNGENEILGSLILKKLGVISPETFAVKVSVNGISTIMLFQESARKELLEKNYRREGPLFEGDEELLWSYKDFRNFELENISLSRMTNKSWFEKGVSSQNITLFAYSSLQLAYQDYAANKQNAYGVIITPNKKESSEFSEYMFALLAMNGAHALRPHNRKFYFNAITSKFEPVYYDGGVSFKKIDEKVLGSSLNSVLSKAFIANVDPNFINTIANLLNSVELKVEFFKRAAPLNNLYMIKLNFDNFFDNAITQYFENIQLLDKKITDILADPSENKIEEKFDLKFLQNLKKSGVSQNLIRKLEVFDDGYNATFQSGNQRNLSIKDVSRVISRNHLDGERIVFLGNSASNDAQTNVTHHAVSFADKLTTSAGVKVNISESAKIVTFTQKKESDWVLIQSGELNDWKIQFDGIQKAGNSKLMTDQRFNQNGLTGCLSFYKSNFQNTTIEVVGGVCEDSVNILASTGDIKLVSVKSAFADAIDIDFSMIDISQIYVDDAGNDCLDVSGGSYQASNIFLNNCSDKGVSVGEGSILFIAAMELNTAKIGVSSKDLSKVEILEALIKDTSICIEVMQKKQEFGGGSLLLDNLECDGIIEVDKNSFYWVGLK